MKLKKSFQKVPSPPPKLSASGWRTGSNLEHWDNRTWTLAKEILGLPVGPVFGNIWVTEPFHRSHLATGRPLSCSTEWVIPSPLSIALEALLEENTIRKLLSLSLDLFFENFAFPGCFSYILFHHSVHEMANCPLAQFDLILVWVSWKLLWAT